MTVGTFCQGDEHGRLIIVKITAKGHLDVLNVLPAVDVTEFDLRRVGYTWMERFVVIVPQNGGVAKVDLRFELLTNEVRHQVCIPIGKHLARAITAGDGGGWTDGAAPHGNLVVLFVLAGHIERDTLLVKEHGIIDETFENVETTRSGFWRRERLHFVLVLVGQAVEVVVRASNGLAGLASNPVVEVQLAWWVNGILDDDGDGLSGTGSACMAFFTVHRRGTQHQR